VTSLSAGCLQRNAWICPDFVTSRLDIIADALAQHIILTVVSLIVGAVVALPLGLLAFRINRLRGLVLGGSTILYTIPSLAMFSLLVPYTGLSQVTVIVGLVLYSLTILVRNVVAGLDAVPDDVEESARGLGFGPGALLLRVQLPLALPTIFAGLRVAATSTVALTTLGILVGYGGLGNLIFRGLQSDFKAQVLTASVLVVALAVVADLAILAVQRLATPWTRRAVA
jgi:osmoprotectant transport system permease protein